MIREKDLIAAAEELSRISGETFQVQRSIFGRWNLFRLFPGQIGLTGASIMRSSVSAHELHEWIYTYRAGIERGLKISAH